MVHLGRLQRVTQNSTFSGGEKLSSTAYPAQGAPGSLSLKREEITGEETFFCIALGRN